MDCVGILVKYFWGVERLVDADGGKGGGRGREGAGKGGG